MLDALVPACEALERMGKAASAVDCLKLMGEAAVDGFTATEQMVAKAGRASYTNAKAQEGNGDPGACACACLIQSLYCGLKQGEP